MAFCADADWLGAQAPGLAGAYRKGKERRDALGGGGVQRSEQHHGDLALYTPLITAIERGDLD